MGYILIKQIQLSNEELNQSMNDKNRILKPVRYGIIQILQNSFKQKKIFIYFYKFEIEKMIKIDMTFE